MVDLLKPFALGEPAVLSIKFYVGTNPPVPTDPTTVTLTVESPDGTEVTYTYPTDAIIVRDSAGFYHADVPTTAVGVWAFRWLGTGAAKGAGEGTFVVTSAVIDALAVLTAPGDYEAVRSVLGVTTADVDNALIELPSFAPQAEQELSDRLGATTLTTLIAGGGDQLKRLRLFTIYWTAALIAETYAMGGMLGNIRGPGEEMTPERWMKRGEDLRETANRWLARVQDADGPDADDEFEVSLLKVGGPTRAWFRDNQVPEPSWWKYPPIINAPPEFDV